ncbi:MAG TPA: GntR family transcriptional regulator [Bryobacteraceae bacterium]|nr:GntR family transcriptional regulator [Bryobacteraceae bacterium]
MPQPLASPALDKSSPVPLYHQLRVELQRQIETGALRPEERLPAEDEIAARFGISKITVREALKLLADAGFVRREQGRGTFVTVPRVEQGPLRLTCFTEEMRIRGMKAASRILDAEILAAQTQLAEDLRIDEGARVFRLKRLRLAAGEPMGIQTTYLPLDRVPGIERENFETHSLYATLDRLFGLRPSMARETHFAVALGRSDATLLGVKAGSPALAAERLAKLPDGQPIEYTCSLMRGDRYQIVLNLREL